MVTEGTRIPIRRALISVYDKTGLVELARELHDAGVEIVSTGSTAARIADSGLPVTPVEELTGFPECLEGRVKTLHPRVHAGILADTRKPEHLEQLAELNVEAFQLVVVNLYPFEETVASGASFDESVEQIDIGGPSMVRAAAKNHPSVAVIVDPSRYGLVSEALNAGGFTYNDRVHLAGEAFAHTASYDVAVGTWFSEQLSERDMKHAGDDKRARQDAEFSPWAGSTFVKSHVLRYGENPHQSAALYLNPKGNALAQARQLHGKEMSYNNYTDADAAWRAAHDHKEPCVAIIKHANPCGIAISHISIADAYRKAHASDPVSAFGGIIASNRPVSVEMAEGVNEVFTEAILATSYEEGAVEVLSQKKNIRILVAPEYVAADYEHRPISGGLLIQELDKIDAPGDDPLTWHLVAGKAVDPKTLADLSFAWRSCRAVKSNAILLAKNGATVGVGMGQVNRVDSSRLAVERAGDRAKGSVGASDAFFPFADGFMVLADAGVTAVVQPGGSIRDDEVIAAAQEAGVTMYFTGVRHFSHS